MTRLHSRPPKTPPRATISARGGGTVHIKQVPGGAFLQVIQDGRTTAAITLDAAGCDALATQLDAAYEAATLGGPTDV